MRALIITLVLAATATAARAQPPDDLRDFAGGHLAMQFPIDDALNDAYGDYGAYGYDGQPFALAGQLYLGRNLLPMLAVGGALEYRHRSEGEGLSTHARQATLFVRMRVRSPSRLFEVGSRLEGGVIHSRSALRGQSLEASSPVMRVGAELVIGRGRFAPVLHYSYTFVFHGDDYEPFTPPRLGGIAFGVGLHHRF